MANEHLLRGLPDKDVEGSKGGVGHEQKEYEREGPAEHCISEGYSGNPCLQQTEAVTCLSRSLRGVSLQTASL